MGSVEGEGLDLVVGRATCADKIISIQRYLPVLGPLMRLPGALVPHLVQVRLQTPQGVRSAKLAKNAGVARSLGSRINGA